MPWDVNLEDGPDGPYLVSLERLEPLYRELIGDRSVIAYCNKGKQSALTYFVLRNLGYDVAAYDGSWHEWGNNPNLPISRGAGAGGKP
jgi:thiosulfate/3-mercaptopyruvate sulfurtransferase